MNFGKDGTLNFRDIGTDDYRNMKHRMTYEGYYDC